MNILPVFLAGLMANTLLANPSSSPSAPPSDPAAELRLGSWGIDLSVRDESIDPGNDFFRYANGKWLDTFEIPADEVRYGSFMVLREKSEERVRDLVETLAQGSHKKGTVEQKVGDYYASYLDLESVNEKGLKPLQPILDRIDAIQNRADLIEIFGRSGRDNLISPIDGGVEIDRKNPDRYMLNLGQSGLGLPDRDYYLLEDARFVEIRRKYQEHIAQMLQFANHPEEEAKEAAAKILELETAVAKEHWPREKLRNRDLTYNVFPVARLTDEFPDFDWNQFLKAAGIPDLEQLNISTPSAIQPIIQIYQETPVETWKSYLAFHAISNHADLLPDHIDQANFEFFGKVLNGQPEQRPRWKRGVQLVGGMQGLGEAIGQVYVERYFPQESKEIMVELVENLREAFRQRLQDIDWMGEATKKEAFAKLETFRPKIGYPGKWRDFSSLEIERDDLMRNVRNVREFFYQDQISRLNKPTDRDEWFMTPQTVNAYYNSSWNEIVFPAAILQPPFFDPKADPAVNYGAIGAVIGHEMGHGFDDQGSKSDARGIQRNWWSEEDRQRFDRRTAALVEQYNQYEPIEGQRVNGQFTLGENIGDLGGLSIAHHAYRISLNGKEAPVLNGLTGDQRFFLSWAQVWKSKNRVEFLLRRLKADPHSPETYRVNGVVRNMDAWYDAFNVAPEDELYLPPEDRVSIW